MLIHSITKKCTMCKEIYPATDEFFYKKQYGLYGLMSRCKKCHNKMTARNHREWAKNHPEKIKEISAKYEKKHREKILIYKRKHAKEYRKQHPNEIRERTYKWRSKNMDKVRSYIRDYYKKHPEIIVEKNHKREARLRGLPADLTIEQWEEIKAAWGYACAYCGHKWHEIKGGLTQDHVIPVIQGGAYTADNIVPACRSCNSKKGGRTPEQAGMTLLKIGH